MIYSGCLSLRPAQCRGDAGVHGTAMSRAAMLLLRWKRNFGLFLLGLFGGDSAKVTLLRGLLDDGGGGGGATSGGGGGVGSELTGELSLGLSR